MGTGTGSFEYVRKAFYGRISDNPNVPAVDDQIRRGKESLAQGETFAHIFRDDNISAWSGKLRPGFVEALESARRGEYDTLVVVEWSRAFRDMEEQQIAQAQLIRVGVNVQMTTGMRVDLQTPEGKFLANMLGSTAQLESDLKRMRVKASITRRLLAGQEIDFKAAFGWENVKDQNGRNIGKKLNEPQAAIVRELHERVLAGRPINSVMTYLNREGIPTMGRGERWTGTSVRSLLRRTRNAAFALVDGMEYPLDIPAIVDRDTFDAVNAVLDSNKVGRREYGRAPAHMLTGRIMSCWCGADIRHHTVRKPSGKVYRWYTCKEVNSHVHADEGDVEREVASLMLMHLALLERDGHASQQGDGRIVALNMKRTDLLRRRGVQQMLAEEEGTDVLSAITRIRELTAELEEVEQEIRERQANDSAERVRQIVLRSAIDVGDGVLVYRRGEHDERFYQWLIMQPMDEQRTFVKSVLRHLTLTQERHVIADHEKTQSSNVTPIWR